jgi:uncharacterized membrane protein
MKKLHIIVCALLIAAAAIASVVCYPALPPSVPVHWGFDGQANAYGPRLVGALLGPVLMSVFLVLGLGLPTLSPRHFGPAAFQRTYSYFIAVIVCSIGFFHVSILYALVNGSNELSRSVFVGICVLLILLGNPMGKVQQNPFVGVRAARALAEPRVWLASNRFGGQLMVAVGVVGLIALAAGAPAWVLLALIGGWTVLVVVYARSKQC